MMWFTVLDTFISAALRVFFTLGVCAGEKYVCTCWCIPLHYFSDPPTKAPYQDRPKVCIGLVLAYPAARPFSLPIFAVLAAKGSVSALSLRS